jgi:AbrB family looped-hinge helix DNA binding protein
MISKSFYKSHLRAKGQITVPPEIRSALGAQEGDDLVFSTDEQGRVIISRAQIIPPDQAWFWSERWQKLEGEAEADIATGRVVTFDNLESALAALDQAVNESDAED